MGIKSPYALFMNTQMSALAQLAEEGWTIYPDFLTPDETRSLREELTTLYEQGKFRKAGIGKGSSFQIRTEIRSDHVHWLEPDHLTDIQKIYWKKIEALRLLFNKEFYLGLKSFEAHFAQYPPGAFYKKHIDQFAQVSYRIISCILYLNPDWKASYGGQLKIYLPDGQGNEKTIEIIPKAGTLVCFKSADIPHEVLPTKKERVSITGWMKNEA